MHIGVKLFRNLPLLNVSLGKFTLIKCQQCQGPSNRGIDGLNGLYSTLGETVSRRTSTLGFASRFHRNRGYTDDPPRSALRFPQYRTCSDAAREKTAGPRYSAQSLRAGVRLRGLETQRVAITFDDLLIDEAGDRIGHRPLVTVRKRTHV